MNCHSRPEPHRALYVLCTTAIEHTKKGKKKSDSSPFLMHYKKACQPRGRSLVELLLFAREVTFTLACEAEGRG